jgi:hypothetical protein
MQLLQYSKAHEVHRGFIVKLSELIIAVNDTNPILLPPPRRNGFTPCSRKPADRSWDMSRMRISAPKLELPELSTEPPRAIRRLT